MRGSGRRDPISFRDLDHLDEWLRWIGVRKQAAAVRATARPTVLFIREHVLDDPLPVGTHKFGGFPDLPRGFAWPTRPVPPRAEDRVAELLRTEEEFLAARTARPTEDGADPGEADRLRAAMLARHAVQEAALLRPFPLAFVAQFDLSDLARGPGLDPALPRRGLLSLFHDVTWKGREGPHWAFWHDRPLSDFDRVAPPEALVDFHDRAGVSYDAGRPSWRAWRHRAYCDRLHPFHAVTVPNHWNDVMNSPEFWAEEGDEADASDESDGDDGGEFTHPAHFAAYVPRKEDVAGDGHKADFNDRLGGWPETFQGSYPEDDLARTKSERVSAPGCTPFRHLFSSDYGCMGDRFMETDRGYGQRIFLLMRDEALAARDFAEVGTTIDFE